MSKSSKFDAIGIVVEFVAMSRDVKVGVFGWNRRNSQSSATCRDRQRSGIRHGRQSRGIRGNRQMNRKGCNRQRSGTRPDRQSRGTRRDRQSRRVRHDRQCCPVSCNTVKGRPWLYLVPLT